LDSFILEAERPGYWTYETKGSDIVVRELFSELHPERDLLIEFFAASYSRSTEMRRILRFIGHKRKQDRIVSVQQLWGRNHLIFGIAGDCESLRRTLCVNNAISPYLSVADGVERWHFYLMDALPQEIIDEMTHECNLIRLSKAPSIAGAFSIPLQRRKEKMELLRFAFAKGYFDYPRRITLTQLAAEVGVCKSSLCESIRLALRDAVSSFTST